MNDFMSNFSEVTIPNGWNRGSFSDKVQTNDGAKQLEKKIDSVINRKKEPLSQAKREAPGDTDQLGECGKKKSKEVHQMQSKSSYEWLMTDEKVDIFALSNVIMKPDHKQRCVELIRAGRIDHLQIPFRRLITHTLSDEMKNEIENVLVLIYLLRIGFMPSLYSTSNQEDSVKKYLKINHFTDILDPFRVDMGNPIVRLIKVFYRFFGGQDLLKYEENDYPTFLAMLMKEIYPQIKTDKIIDDLQAFLNLNEEKKKTYRPYFDRMDFSSKIRWYLYISIVSRNNSKEEADRLCPENLPEYQQTLFANLKELLRSKI